jgi:hypothetical protein
VVDDGGWRWAVTCRAQREVASEAVMVVTLAAGQRSRFGTGVVDGSGGGPVRERALRTLLVVKADEVRISTSAPVLPSGRVSR